MRQTVLFPRRLNSADAGFYFLGRRPDCNVAMVMVGVLAREISFPHMLDELAEAGESVPRFKDFLRRAPLDLAPPIWMPKRGFQVSEQIHEISLPDKAGWSDAVAAVDRFQSKPLPAAAPPWEVALIGGLPDGRSLLAMKVHHALSDGMALSLLFANAFGGKFLEESGLEVSIESEPPPPGSALSTALLDQRRTAGAWLKLAAARLRLFRHDHQARRREIDAARRYWRPPRRPGVGPYSPRRRLCGFQIEAATWEARAERGGGSPNDLYLAIVARAMRRCFPEWDVEAMPLQLVMPVDIRDEDSVQDGGNVTGVGIVELTGTRDALDDLTEVKERSRAAQQQVASGAPSLLDRLIELLPGRARAAIQFREFATRDAVATNVPIPIPGELCGVPFEMMFMIAPPIGAAVGFSLTTYGDHLYLAANADAAVVGGQLEECVAAVLEEAFGEPARSLRGGAMKASLSEVRA